MLGSMHKPQLEGIPHPMKIVMFAASLLTLTAAAEARDIKSDIDAANAKWVAAFNKGDAASVAQLYTEHATALPPGAPMAKGRAAIQAFWQGAIQSGIKNALAEGAEGRSVRQRRARDRRVQPRCTGCTEADSACRGQVCRAVAPQRQWLEARHRYLEHRQVDERSLRRGRQPYRKPRPARRNG